jgi:hypothetical protein
MAGEIPYKIEMPHPEHEKHLCYLENVGYVKANLDDYKKLVRDAKFVCRQCGRIAAGARNVCDPENL